MKKLLAFLLIFVCLSLVLSSCGIIGGSGNGGNGDNGSGSGDGAKKRVPIYQGMSISSDKLMASAEIPMTWAGTNNGNGNNGDNGNHYGQFKGDHEGKGEEIDKDNPFPENGAGESIENEAESSIKVEGAVHEIYYAEPNQDIYIYIHIDNPDSFEIMSFTLNDKKYSSYMFEDGSDMETIILKYNVGNASGIVEYTIDAIKYVDGTEIKDVLIDGDKTVRAGVKTENQVSSAISGVNIGTNSISFNANITDNDGLVAFFGGKLCAVIYDGFEIVAEQELSLGENSVSFDGLKTNTIYQYAVVGYYDDLAGGGFGMNVLLKDAFCTESVVLFSDISVWKDGIDFGLLWHESCEAKQLISLKLYQNDRLVKELSPDATSVKELLSASTYTLIAEYSNGGEAESIYLEFTTCEKVTPVINLNKNSITQSSISFIITEEDEESVGSITKIELIHKNGTTVAENVDVREFTELLSGNEYTVKVTYTYDLNDGNGEQTIVSEVTTATLAKAKPVIEIDKATLTQNDVKASHTITDVDGTLIDYRFDLYKGAMLVKGEAKEINFNSLTYYTEYTVKLTYTYNLNDGKGIQTVSEEYKYTTLPYIDVTGCNIANTSAVSEGDTIFMQVTLDNPLNMTVESVVINGETYNVTGASTAKKIFVEIVYNGQFAGGDTHLKIDKVNAKIDNTIVSVEPKSELADNVFINGKLEVISLEFVNENFETITYSLGSDRIFVLLTLDNPTGYDIDDMKESNVMTGPKKDFIKIDNNHWYYEYFWNWEGGMDETVRIDMENISYSNEYINKTVETDTSTSALMLISNREPIYISTADDLLRMSAGRYYVLTNDIDLSGREWIGGKLSGVFDGNGYSIKNMSFVGTVTNSSIYPGLFSYADGSIENLHIKNATIIADTPFDGSTYAGFFVGCGYNVSFTNCSIDENSIISMNKAQAVGGFAGCIDKSISIFTNCTNSGAVSGNNNVGGFVGDQCYSLAIFTNCTNSGTVSGNANVGGFVGDQYVRKTTFTNCTNNGAVSGQEFVGGFIGYNYDSKLTDCTNIGNVSGRYSVGGLVGKTFGTISFTDCTNIGNISGNRYIGGIVGSCDKCIATFTGCTNSGTISGDYSVSGFVGDQFSTSATFTDCTNNGDISGQEYVGGFVGEHDFSSSSTYTGCTDNGKPIEDTSTQ